MTTTYGQKLFHDTPEWEPMANLRNPHAAGGSIAYDQREGPDRDPFIYHYASATVLNRYSTHLDQWTPLISPAMGTFAAGAGCVYIASAGPSGTLASGTSTSVFTLSTALPAAVAPNQLANRGDGQGYKIRICNKTTGKTEETYIVGNTGGTTPVITVSPALANTPNLNDLYFIMSGRIALFATAATIFKLYDIATNSMITPTVTNLVTPAVDFAGFVIDELYTPAGQLPGTGLVGLRTATGATNTTNATITGTGAAADASLPASEFANLQLRIVEDTTNPTAVGQKLPITSHTSASPTVYTLRGTFGVAPSATCKYVIEGNGDLVVFTGSAVATTCSYAVGGWRADGAWSTNVTNGTVAMNQYPVRPANTAAGTEAIWAYGATGRPRQAGGVVVSLKCRRRFS